MTLCGPKHTNSKITQVAEPLGLQLACLSGSEAQAELLHEGVDLLLLGNEGEQVAHDGLEVLRGEAGLAGQAGQHVWQQVVDGACTLKERKDKFELFSDHDGSLLRRQPGAACTLQHRLLHLRMITVTMTASY